MFYKWRLKVVQPKIFGRILDVGCGDRCLQGAVGIDILPEFHLKQLSASLPILSETFNCVCLMATINYVPVGSTQKVIQECHRVLKKYGRLVITCTTPLGGFIHRLFRWKQPRGISRQEMVALVEKDGLFRLVYDRPFMLGLNRVYVFGKETAKVESYVAIQKIVKEEVHHQ